MPKDDGIFISGGNFNVGALAIGSKAKAVQRITPPAADSDSKSRIIGRSVFISYRRADSKAYAGRLRDALRRCITPPVELFMDIDSIAGGRDFRVAITQALQRSSVVLALIGPSWLTLASPDGLPRLQTAGDLVHYEVKCGLDLGLLVIPVLVDGARMPSEAELPTSLRTLRLRNSMELSDSRWDYDVDRLIQAVSAAPELASRESPLPRRRDL